MDPTDGQKHDRACRAAVGLFAFLLCLGSLGNGRNAHAQIPTDAVERLRIALLTTDDVRLREPKVRECVEALRGVGELRRAVMLKEWKNLDAVDGALRGVVAERFVVATREMLQGAKPDIASLALDMLVEFAIEERDRRDLPRLTRRVTADVIDLTKSADPRVRLVAVRVLGQINPDTIVAVPVLESLLQSPDANLRRVAAEGLCNQLPYALSDVGLANNAFQPGQERRGAVGTANAILAALNYGLVDSQVEVRRPCLTATLRAAVRLQQLLSDAPQGYEDEVERRFGRTQLETERKDLRPLLLGLRDQLPYLAKVLRDEDLDVRIAALASVEAVARVRWRWVRQGVWLGGPTRGELQPLVDDPLGDGLQTVLPALAVDLTDKEVRVRRAALDVLDVLGPAAAPAAPAVARTLTDGDRFVRWSAVRTLQAIGAPGALPALPALANLLEDADVDVGKAAIEALVSLDPTGRGVPPRGKNVPKDAPNRNAVAALAHAVKAHDADVRIAAVHALEGMGENARPAVPALSGALGDADARVRRAAAETLGELGPVARDAVPDLNLALKDPNTSVRRAASDALLRIARSAQP